DRLDRGLEHLRHGEEALAFFVGHMRIVAHRLWRCLQQVVQTLRQSLHAIVLSIGRARAGALARAVPSTFKSEALMLRKPVAALGEPDATVWVASDAPLAGRARIS